MTSQICQTIEEVEEKLDTTPWLVTLEKAEGQLFESVKRAERAWVGLCEKAGCTVIRIDPEEKDEKRMRRGRFVVLVPPEASLPALDRVDAVLADWQTTLKALAVEQSKQPTIGNRSTNRPVWLAPDGGDMPFDSKPAYLAEKVSKTYYQASRSARMTPQAALDILQKKIDEKRDAVARSEANSDFKRADVQREGLKGLMKCLVDLRTLTNAGDAVEVRMSSGRTCKIAVRGRGVSFTTTSATIGLVPCVAKPEIIENDFVAREQLPDATVLPLNEAGMLVIIRPQK